MRLLNTQTLGFNEFFDSQIPPYAILSHRWGEQEITFKEMRKGQVYPGPGLDKIRNFCQHAARCGLRWAWIDTCCIDKRSSAELSEAINAMYQWYESAGHVYVHLSDFELSSKELEARSQLDAPDWFSEVWPFVNERFRKSSWFTRGWTLQELMAPCPDNVYFFDRVWNSIGSLNQVIDDVSKTTGIPKRYMGFKIRSTSNYSPIADSCIAQRMSWAAHRHTSREEDMAYCLLGMFDISMPLLYGEGGEKAFFRLQREIMSNTDDESLFAWTSNQTQSGLLAASPIYFANSRNVRRCYELTRQPFSLTNRGLRIQIPQKQAYMTGKHIHTQLYLCCCDDPGKDQYNPPLLVLCLQPAGENNSWFRVKCDTLNALPQHKQGLSISEMANKLKEDPVTIYIIDPNKEGYQASHHYSEMARKRERNPPSFERTGYLFQIPDSTKIKEVH